VTDTRPTSANRILETALDLFASHGYDATSVQAICDAAHITKPTLYHFYGSKEGVYKALYASALERVCTSLFAALAAEGPLVERLKVVVRDLFADATANPKLWRFLGTTVWSPGSAPVADAHCNYEEIGNLIAGAIDAAVQGGELMPGPTAVRVLVLKGAVSETLDSFVLFGEPALTPELGDQLIDAVFGGWLAAAAAASVTNGHAATSSPQDSSLHSSFTATQP
jgi:AcrR family transcriptional regulator